MVEVSAVGPTLYAGSFTSPRVDPLDAAATHATANNRACSGKHALKQTWQSDHRNGGGPADVQQAVRLPVQVRPGVRRLRGAGGALDREDALVRRRVVHLQNSCDILQRGLKRGSCRLLLSGWGAGDRADQRRL